MTEYSVSAASRTLSGANPVLTAPAFTLIAAQTAKPTVTSVLISQFGASGASTSLALGRPSTSGIKPIGGWKGYPVSDDGAGPALSYVVTDWIVAPSAPTQYLRRASPNATTGASILWSFPRGLTLPSGGQLGVFFIPAGAVWPVYEGTFVFDE